MWDSARRSTWVFTNSQAPYLAALNDDAAPRAGWIEALVVAAEAHPDAGMFASQVRFFGEEHLDSAGMLIAPRRQQQTARTRAVRRRISDPEEEVLLPSASAALLPARHAGARSALFDEDFFLYCEDTDLGLRARWAGWKCLYVPEAVVEHHYSHSAGRASRAEGVLRGAQPAVCGREEFSSAECFGRLRWPHWRDTGGTPGTMALGRGTAAQFRREGNEAWRLALDCHSRPLAPVTARGHAIAEAPGDPWERQAFGWRVCGSCSGHTPLACGGWQNCEDCGWSTPNS